MARFDSKQVKYSLPCVAWFMTLSCRYAITKPQRVKSVAVTLNPIASELSMETA